MSDHSERHDDSDHRSDHKGGRLGRLSGWFGRRRDVGVRHSIAALVQEAAEAREVDGQAPDLDRQERALIANVLRLRETSAYDVMVPRADIVAMPLDTDLPGVLDIMRRENHSRMPVYREQLDDVVGMVHLKDVVGYVGNPEAFSLAALLRPPLLVAPSLAVLDLLLQMRQQRTHLALVIDEYGGIDGLLTIEDLVETIVGDIADEHDEPFEEDFIERADGTFDIDARLPVETFEERAGKVLTEDERDSEIHTVGGLVFNLAGRVPARGEILAHDSGTEFRVIDADARHIRRLRVRLPERSDEATRGDQDAA